MPRSMTGYGAAQTAGTRIAVDIEIRAVNARNLKLSTRISNRLLPHEADLDALVRRRVRRGTVTISARVHMLRPQDAVRIRSEVVEGLALALEPLRERGLVQGTLTPDGVTSIPGAIDPGTDDPLRPADWKLVKGAVEQALDALDAMRAREAVHLVKDLRAILKSMGISLTRVRRRAPKVVREHQIKLRERVDNLLRESGISLDETTLAREVALVADRSDVREEVTRLGAHLDEFARYLEQDKGELGRTLEFLSQEMLRETNTIGSKSSDVEIARAVIALKSDIDRLKEQVANLE